MYLFLKKKNLCFVPTTGFMFCALTYCVRYRLTVLILRWTWRTSPSVYRASKSSIVTCELIRWDPLNKDDIGFACISVYTCMYMFTLAELGLDLFTLYVFMLIFVECPCVCSQNTSSLEATWWCIKTKSGSVNRDLSLVFVLIVNKICL